MKNLYLDCFSGISGDMMVGALLDLGLPESAIKDELGRLPLDGFELAVEKTKKNGIDSTDFKVRVGKKQRPRDYKTIREMLESSSLKDGVRRLSLRVFELLAEAEGKVHGVAPDDVHFHEVGGVDSIVDIVGTAIGIDHFRIKEVYSSSIITGTGMVATDHGQMPVPAPATAELLKGVPFVNSEIKGELVTPTGAAILKALARGYGAMPEMKVERVGYGAGDRDFGERPNLLRVFLGKETGRFKGAADQLYERDEVDVIETAIDDMNPQYYEPLMDELFGAGALDAAMIPLYMKKGRPGTLLQVLASPEKSAKIIDIIFSESTAIGLRCRRTERLKLKRKSDVLPTPLGDVEVKVIGKPDGSVEVRPEYESLKGIAKEKGLPIVEVSARIGQYLSVKGIKPEK